jgi:hypothetical protein
LALATPISAHYDAPDFYLNSDTLRIRRAAAIAGKPGGILEEPEVIRDQTS